MNDRTSIVSLSTAWAGVAANALLQHVNALLAAAAAVCAILASFYAYRVNREKLRRIEAANEHACAECRRRKDPELCPFPAAERPDWCIWKKP
jgi:hypothetical protein